MQNRGVSFSSSLGALNRLVAPGRLPVHTLNRPWRCCVTGGSWLPSPWGVDARPQIRRRSSPGRSATGFRSARRWTHALRPVGRHGLPHASLLVRVEISPKARRSSPRGRSRCRGAGESYADSMGHSRRRAAAPERNLERRPRSARRQSAPPSCKIPLNGLLRTLPEPRFGASNSSASPCYVWKGDSPAQVPAHRSGL